MFRPNTTDLHHLSLTANNISAKLTNQCTQTGLSTFNWQLPFTWLWWLLLRLSKRQSPLPTTVLLRTTITWTIKLHYCMLPPGSNHLLNNISIDLSIFNLFSIWSIFNLLHERHIPKRWCLVLLQPHYTGHVVQKKYLSAGSYIYFTIWFYSMLWLNSPPTNL